jgi:hypothetical protein
LLAQGGDLAGGKPEGGRDLDAVLLDGWYGRQEVFGAIDIEGA